MLKGTTAILFFSRSANAEQRVKKIVPGQNKNRQAITNLIKNSLQQINQSGLPWFMCDETMQLSNGFGPNLSQAIQAIFLKGYKKIIVAGNDCPFLSHHILLKAATALQQNDWVLGATPKGGLYLIGITATSFNAKAFEQLPWHTTMAYDALTLLIKANKNSLHCLQQLSDINSIKDIISLSHLCCASTLIHFLFDLIQAVPYLPAQYQSKPPYQFIFTASGRRGPPIF
jgi:uncharacterized protein